MKSLNVNYNYLLIGAIIAVLCLPSAFLAQYSLGAINSAAKYCGFALAVMYFIAWSLYNRKLFLPLFSYFVWMIVSTALSGNSVKTIFISTYPILTVAVLVYVLTKIDWRGTVRFISYLFTAELVANFLSFLSGGYYRDTWNVMYFIGIRVNINGLFLAGVSIALLNAYLGTKIDKAVFLCALFSGGYFVIGEWVSTSILSISIFGGIMLFSWMIRKWPNKDKLFKRIGLLLLVLILLFMMNPDVSRFSWLIEDLLGESLTLDGRTELWSGALSQIKGIKWLFGNGYGSGTTFRTTNGFTATTAHSQYINIVYGFGIIGLMLYTFILIQQVRKYSSVRNQIIRSILFAAFVSMIIMNIVNSTYFEPYGYIWWVMCLTLPESSEFSEEEEKI